MGLWLQKRINGLIQNQNQRLIFSQEHSYRKNL